MLIPESKELERRKLERDKLFLQPVPSDNASQYQRMRYEREIEATEYVKLLRTGWTYPAAALQARKNANAIVANWNEHCSIWNLKD